MELFNTDLEYDLGDLLGLENQEAMELSDHGKEQPADSMGLLVCGEDDIFTDSQLLEAVNNSTPDPVPARDAETKKALQPEGFNWAKEVK